jgi:CRP-like cAMP-binding protein
MYTLSEKIDLLKSCELFETISYDELKLIAFTASEIFCQEGDILFLEGDEAFESFVIFDGEVEVFKTMNGGTTVLRTLKKNDIFGEYAIISQCPRTAGVKSKKFSGLKISKDSFLEILKEFPEVSIRIMDVLVKRLLKSEKKLLELMEKKD